MCFGREESQKDESKMSKRYEGIRIIVRCSLYSNGWIVQ